MLLPKQRARLANSGSKIDLEILGHGFLGMTNSTRGLALLDHTINPPNSLLAQLEAAGDVLGEPFNLALLTLLDVFAFKAG